MPIEFNCGQCGQRLRVPDTSAGKKAKCPKCEQVLNVPDAAAAAPNLSADAGTESANPFGAPPASAPGSVNPFGSPTSPYQEIAGGPQGEITTGTLDAGFALSTAWEMFKPNLALLTGAALVQFGANIAMQITFSILNTVIAQSTGDPMGPEAIGMQVVGSVIQQVVNSFFAIGIILMCLKVARNQNAEFSDLFAGGKYFFRVIGGSILYGLMVFVGILLFIIPGIYLALKYLPFMYCIVDRDCSIADSFRTAGEISTGNKMQLFLMGIIGMGIGILGFLLLCIGIIPATAVNNLMYTVGYLMMSSQPLMRPTQQTMA